MARSVKQQLPPIRLFASGGIKGSADAIGVDALLPRRSSSARRTTSSAMMTRRTAVEPFIMAVFLCPPLRAVALDVATGRFVPAWRGSTLGTDPERRPGLVDCHLADPASPFLGEEAASESRFMSVPS
jgi:hypothetical protein